MARKISKMEKIFRSLEKSVDDCLGIKKINNHRTERKWRSMMARPYKELNEIHYV